MTDKYFFRFSLVMSLFVLISGCQIVNHSFQAKPQFKVEHDYVFVLDIDSNDTREAFSKFKSDTTTESDLRIKLVDARGNELAFIPFSEVSIQTGKRGEWLFSLGNSDNKAEYFRVVDIKYPKNKFFSISLTSAKLADIVANLESTKYTQTDDTKLITCGPSHVSIYSIKDDHEDIDLKWSWLPKLNKTLPTSIVNTFLHIDECKPLSEGRLLLVTSSTGGNAVIESKTGNLLYYAYATQAHSMEVLPENQLVIAVSTHKNFGDELLLLDFNTSSLEPVQRIVLDSAHGVYFDKTNHYLWALGRSELNKYSLESSLHAPTRLRKVFTTFLPSTGGHDLSPFGNKAGQLFVTSNSQVFIYDVNAGVFTEHPRLKKYKFVKSISQSGLDTAVVQADFDQGVWWSQCVIILDRVNKLCATDRRFYKARFSE